MCPPLGGYAGEDIKGHRLDDASIGNSANDVRPATLRLWLHHVSLASEWDVTDDRFLDQCVTQGGGVPAGRRREPLRSLVKALLQVRTCQARESDPPNAGSDWQ